MTVACVNGSSADVTECACTGGLFGDGRRCNKCTDCEENAQLVKPCELGSSVDSTQCACNAGYFSPTGFNCSKCPVGTWGPGGSFCLPCGRGLYSNAMGLTALELCRPCPVGTFGPREKSGNLTAACDPCPPNTETVPGAQNRSQCFCMSHLTGQITETGGSCSGCEAGDYFESSNKTCTKCPANTNSPRDSDGVWRCKANAGYYARHTKTVKLRLQVPDEDASPAIVEAYVRAAAGGGEDLQVIVE